MKKQLFLLLALIIGTTTFAQGGFTNYKAVVIDGGTALANHSITVRFTVLHGATQVFQETQTTTTDANGIITLNIGEANPTPWFAIQWKQLGFSLKTEYDTGSGFVDMGTQNFRFMPYAQHARTASIADVADEVDFNNIINIPADLADGDDDTQLTEAQVDNYVANNGYATELNDLSDAKTIYSSVYVGSNSGTNDIGIETIGAGTAQTANTGLGKYALKEITNGRRNVAIGSNALKNNVSGGFNIGLGSATLVSLTSGSGNVAVGEFAGRATNGSGNIFIGNYAGYNESGSDKLYIENSSSSTPLIGGDFSTDEVTINGTLKITGGTPGSGKVFTSDTNGKGSWQTPVDNDTHLTEAQVDNYVANNGYATELNELSDAKTGGSSYFIGNNAGANDDGATNYNVGYGREALNDNVNGKYNTAIGNFALKTNVGNKGNTAIGYQAFIHANNSSISSFGYNVAVGYNTLRGSATAANNTGKNNTAIGATSLYNNTSGSNNSILGFNAFRNNTEGNYNVAIGRSAGYHNQTGNNNVNIGYNAGYNNQTGDYNVFIGSRAGFFETGNNKLYIDNSDTSTPLIYGDFNSDELTINGSLAIKDGTQANGKVLVSDANGNASWSNSLPKQTKTINYAPNNFTVYRKDYDFRIGYTFAYIVSTATASRYLMLPFNLPQGVTITNIKIYYRDNSTSNLEFVLKTKNISNPANSTATLGVSSNEDNAVHLFEFTTPIIFDSGKAYTLAIKNKDGAWGTTGDIRIYGVSITYEE